MKALRTTSDKSIDIFIYLSLTIILLSVIYPLYFIVIASFSDPTAVLSGKVWMVPVRFNLESYKMVLRDPDILSGYKNTLMYTVVGTTINVLMTIAAAYPLSQKKLKGRGIVMTFMVFTLFFKGGLIPTYLLVSNLNMIDSFWSMVIPNAVAVMNIIIMRTFFQNNVPVELEEASFIDGSTFFGSLRHVILPLSKPIIAVMVLFYGVTHWNAFFNGLIYLTSKGKFPLQLIMRGILIQNQLSESMMTGVEDTVSRQMLGETIKYALIIVASVPVLCLYPFLQRYFVKGVMVGSIKG